MQFDVIIGNPPYQMKDGGYGASAKPLYPEFVTMGKKLDPTYMSFIIPARWYTGGKGLDEFREQTINDRRVSHIVDYPNSSECFPGVEIKGGIMYFLWNKNHNGNCSWVSVRNEEQTTPITRDLRQTKDILLRDITALNILTKVQKKHKTGQWMNTEVSSAKPFGLRTFVKGTKIQTGNQIKLYQNKGIGYINPENIKKNKAWINKWKAIIPEAGGDGMKKLPNVVTGKPLVAEKGTACTETYLIAGLFDTPKEAERRVAYMKTRFFRYMISLKKITQHNTSKVFTFAPVMDPTQDWTDEKLYKHFNLTPEEISHIEATVKNMP